MHLYTEEGLCGLLKDEAFTWSKYPALKEQLTSVFCLRPLNLDDYKKGFFDLICKDDVSYEETDHIVKFQEYYSILQSCLGMYYPVVVEDRNQGKIIASATLIVEQKFIHETALRGRIENLVVLKEYRRNGIGSLMLETLSILGQKLGCYKTTLNCCSDIVGFCENLKFVAEPSQNFMLRTFELPNYGLISGEQQNNNSKPS